MRARSNCLSLQLNRKIQLIERGFGLLSEECAGQTALKGPQFGHYRKTADINQL